MVEPGQASHVVTPADLIFSKHRQAARSSDQSLHLRSVEFQVICA